MKKLLNLSYFIFITIILFTINLNSQQLDIIDETLPTCYTHRYFVYDDYSSPMYWDESTQHLAQGYPTFHGGDNQIWFVMPTYPGSKEAMIVNKREGRLLSWDPGIDKLANWKTRFWGVNQLFHMEKKTAGFCPSYAIRATWQYEYFDRSLNHNTLYLTDNIHFGENQLFHFETYTPIVGSDKLRVYYDGSGLDLPPMPMSFEDSGEFGTEHSIKLISETIIPFPLINENELPIEVAVEETPYYILKKWQYYKLIDNPPYGDLGFKESTFFEPLS